MKVSLHLALNDSQLDLNKREREVIGTDQENRPDIMDVKHR